MRSHCFDLLEQDLQILLGRLEDEGLVARAADLNDKLRAAGTRTADGFWKLTAAGAALLRDRDPTN